MSIRYIWGKYTAKKKYYSESLSVNEVYLPGSLGDPDYNVACLKSGSPALDSDTGTYSYSGSYKVARRGATTSDDVSTNTYNYASAALASKYPYTGSETTGYVSGMDSYLQRRYTNTYWRYRYDSSAPNSEKMNAITCVNGTTKYAFYYYFPVLGNYPDEFIEYLSGSSSKLYPSFDVSDDGYFYYSVSNDLIDPKSVTIPSAIVSGSKITITIDPSDSAVSNSYGNISYSCSYKFNDTDWKPLGDGASLSYTLDIPKGKTSVKVRVLAKDDIGFVSSTYVESKETPIYASMPPSAPSSITVDRVVSGWDAIVTVTPATDDDGSIQYYVFERKVDSGEWTEVQKSSSLEYVDTISSYWTTVAYRAYAIDDSGVSGDYATTETYSIEKDVIVIIGPKNVDFGNKVSSFNLSFYVLISGDNSGSDVLVTVVVDSEEVYSKNTASGQMVTVGIDTSDLSKDRHAVEITATKEGYKMAQTVYNFVLVNLTLPEGSNIVQFQDSKGKGVLPITSAKATLLSDGTDVETKLSELESKLSSVSP